MDGAHDINDASDMDKSTWVAFLFIADAAPVTKNNNDITKSVRLSPRPTELATALRLLHD